MVMLCPICKTTTMEPGRLEAELEVEQCTTCRGAWITSARYFGYTAGEGGEARETTAAGTTADPGPDLPGLKMCPACRQFMRCYPVGHGVAFGIDKCNTCGGVWLNGGEWAALKARGLHLKVHAISSDAWQAVVEQENRERQEEEAMLRRLGATEYAELRRVAAWLAAHEHRTEVWAYLRRVVEE